MDDNKKDVKPEAATAADEGVLTPKMIKGIVVTREGTYQVTVELNDMQHQLIFETGLAMLLAMGTASGVPLTSMVKVSDAEPAEDEHDISVFIDSGSKTIN